MLGGSTPNKVKDVHTFKSLLGYLKNIMGMPSRFTYKMFHLDTNRINAKQHLENMNILEKWHENGVIELALSEVSFDESFAGNNAARKKKASDYNYSLTYAETPEEKKLISRIEGIIFPEGVKDQNQENDVTIIFNASKYNRILITNDGDSKKQPGGILGNAKTLKKEIDVNIITDEEAIYIVKKAIEDRDKRAIYISKNRGEELPEWVGKD